MREKKNKRKKEGANWMDTYGDLVTLLLTFFVMLFAASTINEAKWASMVESFTGFPPSGYGTPIDLGAAIEEQSVASEMPAEQEKSQEQIELEERINTLYQEMRSYVDENGMEESLFLSKDGLYISLTIAEGVLFDSGKADIRNDDISVQVLTDIGNMLTRYIGDIQNITIEGHTDNMPIRTDEFEDNLDLSNKRASNVARFMSGTSEIEMKMFLSMGRSEWEPIADNNTEEGRQKNRRVNIIILAKDLDSARGIRAETIISAVESTG